MARPLARFRIRLHSNKNLVFEFRVYRTATEMRTATKTRGTLGVCEVEANAKSLAVVSLCSDHVTHEIVAHECSHAALAMVKAVGRSPETEDGEEDLATATGLLVERFWTRWGARFTERR